MQDKFSITNLTRGQLPRLPFRALKEKVLGKKYDLSLVFIDENKSKELNRIYRKKNKPTNVLSFPLGKLEGEIFICIKVAKKEAAGYGKTWQDFLAFLVIHGMLHLKGLRHGSIMDKAEKKYDEKYQSWNRRGNDVHTGGRGRILKRRKVS